MKVLRDFNGTKEPVATGGITTYPTGTGCCMAVESDLSSFDVDKMPIKGLGSGEMPGSSRRAPFVLTPCGTARTHQTALINQSKQCPKEGATHCCKYQGLGFGFFKKKAFSTSSKDTACKSDLGATTES